MTEINSEDIVIPVHSNNMNDDLKNSDKKEKYAKLKREHYRNQTKSTRREMKKNEKLNDDNTPIRKKKTSLFSRRKSCVNKIDETMLMDGVSDTRHD